MSKLPHYAINPYTEQTLTTKDETGKYSPQGDTLPADVATLALSCCLWYQSTMPKE